MRAVLLAVDERNNARRLLGSGSADYSHSCISHALPSDIVGNGTLPPGYVLQHAADWIDAARQALDKAIMKQSQAGNEVISIVGSFQYSILAYIEGNNLRAYAPGIGTDFTACTWLPCLEDGTPLYLVEGDHWLHEPHAW